MWHKWSTNNNFGRLVVMADTYYFNLQVSEYSDFSELVINAMVELVTSATFSGLSYGTTYYWRVKRINNQTGKESEWSAVCSFSTAHEDVVIDRSGNTVNIIFVAGNNTIRGQCDIPDGILGYGICISAVGEGKIGSPECICNCQQYINI